MKNKPDKNLTIALTIAALTFLVGFCVMCSGSRESDTMTMEQHAWYSCQIVIEDNLKAPTTAKFQRYSPEEIDRLSEFSYRLYMYVDAQNSFGAMIRSQFVCEITFSEDMETYTARIKEL